MSDFIPVEADPFEDGWDLKYQNSDRKVSVWSDDPQPFILSGMRMLRPGSTVIDLGCGDGRNTRALIANGHRVTALDISETALLLLQDRLHAAAIAIPTPIIGKLDAIPIASAHFDAALAADVLPQIQDTRSALEEIHRVLKPGGLLLVNVFTPEDCAYGQGEEISPRCYGYKNCLFRFFEANELDQLSSDLFEVVSAEHFDWWDPPHGAFRPYPHKHDAFFYILRKR